MNKLRVGIIGAGWIADKMGLTLRPMEDATGYAIASRDLSKAQATAGLSHHTCHTRKHSKL